MKNLKPIQIKIRNGKAHELPEADINYLEDYFNKYIVRIKKFSIFYLL